MQPSERTPKDVQRTSSTTSILLPSSTLSSSNYLGRTASIDPYHGDANLKLLESDLKDKIDVLNPHGYMTASKILWHYSLNIPELNHHNQKYNTKLYSNLAQYINSSILENDLLANELKERNLRIKEDRYLSTCAGGLLGLFLNMVGSNPISNITAGGGFITLLALNEYSPKIDRLALTAGLTALLASWHLFNVN